MEAEQTAPNNRFRLKLIEKEHNLLQLITIPSAENIETVVPVEKIMLRSLRKWTWE